MNDFPSTVFVYGTLKRGERREFDWPREPASILPAVVRGDLFDLDRYPALRPGTGYVRGECWEIADEHLAETLRVLDAIERYRNRDDDLYYRDVIWCDVDDGTRRLAYTYLFAQTSRLQLRSPIPSDPNQPAHWTRGASRQ